MHVVLEIEEDRALFVIRGLDPDFHSAALRLGFGRADGSFAATCPATSPHLGRAFENFQRSLEPLLFQVASMRPVPWEQDLLAWLDRVEDESSLEWWLAGSTALAVRGLAVAPGDIDLIVAEGSEERVDELLADWLIQPSIPTPGWVHQSFGRAFLHCRLEWCVGVNDSADAVFDSDQGPTAAARLETVEWRGYSIRVPPLELQLNTARHRGMEERATLIQRATRAKEEA